MALRELLVAFGVDVQGKEKLDAVETKLDGIIAKVERVGQVFAAAFLMRQITGFITDQIEVGRSLSVTADKLGVTVDELERYRFAADQAGVSTYDSEQALMYFNRNLGQAEYGSKGAVKALAQFGLSMTDAQGHALPLSEVLGKVADKFVSLPDRTQKAHMAMRLFGRGGASIIPLLNQGSAGIKKYSEEFDELGGGIGQGFAEEAKKAGEALRKVNFQWTVFKTRIVNAVMPAVEKIIWLFSQMLRGLDYLQKHSYFAQTALIALATAAVIAFAPFLASILPIVAALGAMYLLFDDLYTLFRGGDTLIGRFIDKLFGVGTAKQVVQEVKDKFKELMDWVENEGIPKAKAFGHWLYDAFNNAIPVIREVIKDVGRAADLLSGSWMAAAHGIAGAAYSLTGKSEDADKEYTLAGQAVDRAGNAVFGNKSGESIMPSDAWRNATPTIPGTSFQYTPPYGGPGQKRGFSMADDVNGSQAPVKVEQRNTFHVVVQGGDDPEQTSQAVRKGLSQGLDDSIRHALNSLPNAGGGK